MTSRFRENSKEWCSTLERTVAGSSCSPDPEGLRKGSSHKKVEKNLFGQHHLTRFLIVVERYSQSKVTQQKGILENNFSASFSCHPPVSCNGSHWSNPTISEEEGGQANMAHPSQYLRA